MTLGLLVTYEISALMLFPLHHHFHCIAHGKLRLTGVIDNLLLRD